MKNLTESILTKSKFTNDDFITLVYKTNLDLSIQHNGKWDIIDIKDIKNSHYIDENFIDIEVDMLEDLKLPKHIDFTTGRIPDSFSLKFTGRKIQGFTFKTNYMRLFISTKQEVCDCNFEDIEDLDIYFYDESKPYKSILITHLDKDGNYKVNNTKLLQKMFHDNQFNMDIRGKITRFNVGIRRDGDYDEYFPKDLGLISHYLECSRNNLYPKYL